MFYLAFSQVFVIVIYRTDVGCLWHSVEMIIHGILGGVV